MVNAQDVLGWRGRTAYDRAGDKIGKIEQIYLDNQSGAPEWAAVHTGLFGARLNLVPLDGSSPDGDDVRVAFDKATVKDAPQIDAEAGPSIDEERALYEHYGMGYTMPSTTGDARRRGDDDAASTADRDRDEGRGDPRLRRYSEDRETREDMRETETNPAVSDSNIGGPDRR